MDKMDYDTRMEAPLGDRDTYRPVDKLPFAKIEKELNNRLLWSQKTKQDWWFDLS